MAGIVLDHLSKNFEGDVPAVRDVSLRIPDRELTVLVGPSGCGKTTVLRMIAGLETPSAGTIRIGERDVTELPPRDRDVAMVFQNYALYPHLTVRENIAFPLEMRRVPSTGITTRVREAAESLGIEELLERRPSQLSGGQRQRVALARAIVREPQVFLFDEPLSNLDAQVRAQTRAELVNLQRRLGATMLYVTHDQVEAMTMATGVAVMQHGRVEQFGAPLDIYRTPETLVVASFVGSPSINRFDGRIVAQSGSPHFLGALTVPVAASPMGVATLAVRPEHLRVDAPEGSPKAVITLVEALGPETLVHLRFEGGETGVARLSGAHRFDVGATLLVTVDPRDTLIFDGAGRLAWHGDL